MEGEMQPAPACVSMVLDDDVLAEVIVRIGCPTSLVRAATVCRRWLRLASDHAFLRRFRKLHPPRLLGFYLGQAVTWSNARPLFISMLPTPELPAVVRRASFRLDPTAKTDMAGCRNGRVLTCTLMQVGDNPGEIQHYEITSALHSPMYPAHHRGTIVIPTLRIPVQKRTFCTYGQLFLKEEEGGQVTSYFYVMVDSTSRGTLHVYTLQSGDDAWRKHLTLAAGYFILALSMPRSLLVGDKIYMPTAKTEILVLDLAVGSFSTIQLPQGVRFGAIGTTMLSRVDDGASSDVYLIHAKDLQIHVWLHKGGNWLLVDNICLRQMCAHFLEDAPAAVLKINHVGDYTSEFLFLEMGRHALYLDVKCRTLRKVYEMTYQERHLGTIFPFTMSWPPIFPVLQDGPTSNAT